MQGPPPGWVSIGGVLQRAERVRDYADRKQEVVGLCRTQGCWRKAVLDPNNLVARGYGDLDIRLVQRFWRCQRFDSCGLEFSAGPAAMALKLSDLTNLPEVRIRLRCDAGGCSFTKVAEVQEVIDGLVSRNQGDGNTDPLALGPLMTAPCKTCGGVRWRSEVLWPAAPPKPPTRPPAKRFQNDCGYDLNKADWPRS